MEVTDLMVGDLIVKHTATRGDMVCTVTPCIINSYEFDWSSIPFAEEIFEKNEFERNTFNGTIIYSKHSYVDIDWYDVIVEIGKDAEGIQRWDCVRIKIQKAGANLTLNNQSCFHQLQHALRLVGLKDVANKLIVE